jgi:eukaryotic-like serine/threonine-protein kinase
MPDVIDRLNAALDGRYHLLRMLGEGGMATVYLADDLRHERQVALKVLKPELAAVVGAERFLAEIKTTANLHHPHILPLFDSGEADSFLFYVMPYVDGETLRSRLARDHQLPVEEAVAIASAVAQALQHAHDRGVIHRDIKPANILTQDGQPVVSDFGIALALGAGGARLTETGLSLGTPYYMSPEQATGDQHVGPASDIYALAAVLYEMLTGDPPYVGSTAQAVLGKIIQGVPVSATAARSSVPAHVDAAIRKGLEKLPADRFQSAKDFAKALGDPTFRHGATVAGPAAAAGPWKRVALAASAVAVVALGALGVNLMSGRSGAAPPVMRFEVSLGDSVFLGGQGTRQGPRPTVTSLALYRTAPCWSTRRSIRPEARPIRASTSNVSSRSARGRSRGQRARTLRSFRPRVTGSASTWATPSARCRCRGATRCP